MSDSKTIQPFSRSLDYSLSAFAAVYHYREMDTTLMTGGDENRDMGLWPSAGNIVSLA